MIDTNRLSQLQSMYLRVIYVKIEEEKAPKPSEAILAACDAAKSAIYREHELIEKRRGVHHGR